MLELKARELERAGQRQESPSDASQESSARPRTPASDFCHDLQLSQLRSLQKREEGIPESNLQELEDIAETEAGEDEEEAYEESEDEAEEEESEEEEEGEEEAEEEAADGDGTDCAENCDVRAEQEQLSEDAEASQASASEAIANSSKEEAENQSPGAAHGLEEMPEGSTSNPEALLDAELEGEDDLGFESLEADPLSDVQASMAEPEGHQNLTRHENGSELDLEAGSSAFALCLPADDVTGYVVTEDSLRLDDFSVRASCSVGFDGMALVSSCDEANRPYQLGGCKQLPCLAMNATATEAAGYVVTEVSLSPTDFRVLARCLPGFAGTAQARPCASPGEDYELTGCEAVPSCLGAWTLQSLKGFAEDLGSLAKDLEAHLHTVQAWQDLLLGSSTAPDPERLSEVDVQCAAFLMFIGSVKESSIETSSASRGTISSLMLFSSLPRSKPEICKGPSCFKPAYIC